jgi:hypothetical protein
MPGRLERLERLMSRVKVAFVVALITSCSCAPPAVDACRQQCDKRASCSDDIDVTQCHRACEDSTLVGNDACVDAQLDLQRCQVSLDCATYLDDGGCTVERAAVTNAC